MKDLEIQKILDDFNNSPVSKYYEEKGEGVASANANRKAYGQTETFKKQAIEMAKVGGKLGGITKKRNGFDYRKISLIGAEKMKNMSLEMRKEYGDRAIKIHKGKKRSDEVKRNISEATKGRVSHNKGKKFSEESCKKMSDSAKGKVISEQQRQKTKKWMLENNPFKGKKHTEETKQIIKDKHPSKIKMSCEYCNRELDLPNYKRYHGDKCKLKQNIL